MNKKDSRGLFDMAKLNTSLFAYWTNFILGVAVGAGIVYLINHWVR